LRYPGGKTPALKFLLPFLPTKPSVLVSPFVGGGSLELAAAARGWQVHAYDAFQPLVDFWQILLTDRDRLVDAVQQYHPLNSDQFYALQRANFTTQVDRAAAFFALNRASREGLTYSGGFNKSAMTNPRYDRFTPSSIDALRRFVVSGEFWVERSDFRDTLAAHPDDLLFLDPPYYLISSSNLYGRRGDLHKNFPHEELRDRLHERSRWILCYNDDPKVREWYDGFFTWSYKTGDCRSELLVVSRDLEDHAREVLPYVQGLLAEDERRRAERKAAAKAR
jgi:DNA adenine methylase